MNFQKLRGRGRRWLNLYLLKKLKQLYLEAWNSG